MKTTVIILSLLFITESFARFSFGTYSASLGKYQDDEEGGTNGLQLNPYIGINHTMPLPGFKDFLFIPEFGITFHRNTESYSKKTISLLLDAGYQIKGTRFLVLSGLGLIYTRQKGDGGTITLGNGTSTAEFHIPDESSTAKNASFNLGFMFKPEKMYGFKSEVIVLKTLNSTERDINLLLTLNYYP